MTSKQIYGITGVCLIFLACFLPLAKLNDFIITIFPVWGNMFFQGGIWSWRDISFFAFTLALLIVLSAIFAFRKNYMGLLINSLLVLFVILIIFVTLLQVQSKASVYSNITFHIGWGWASLLPGAVLLLFSAISRKNHSGQNNIKAL